MDCVIGFLTKGAPLVFLRSGLICDEGSMIECAIAGMCVAHREANVAIVKFVRRFIDLYLKYAQRVNPGVTARRSNSVLACIPIELLKPRAQIVDSGPKESTLQALSNRS